VAQAIRSMQVRGAPLIGVTAAYGVALALVAACADDATLLAAMQTLAATRPTAVNLHWALAPASLPAAAAAARVPRPRGSRRPDRRRGRRPVSPDRRARPADCCARVGGGAGGSRS
jgi:hypothetical protein